MTGFSPSHRKTKNTPRCFSFSRGRALQGLHHISPSSPQVPAHCRASSTQTDDRLRLRPPADPSAAAGTPSGRRRDSSRRRSPRWGRRRMSTAHACNASITADVLPVLGQRYGDLPAVEGRPTESSAGPASSSRRLSDKGSGLGQGEDLPQAQCGLRGSGKHGVIPVSANKTSVK
jgi:hypothetical protein